MTFIKENTFAAACYQQNSIADLEAALQGAADKFDMEAWGISADEWREQIALALQAKREDLEQAD